MSVLDKALRAGDAASLGMNHLNTLVHGLSGSGKTTLGARSSELPLVLLTESNGATSIMEANPEARIFPVETIQDLDAAFDDVSSRVDRGEKLPWGSIVLDSVTEMQRLIADDLKAKAAKIPNAKDPAVQKDGSLTQNGWGILVDRTMTYLRRFRDLPIDVVALFLTKELGEGINRYYRPQVFGKALPGDLAGLFNLVLFSFKDRSNALGIQGWEEGRMQYVLGTDLPSETHLTKGHASLATYEAAGSPEDPWAFLKMKERVRASTMRVVSLPKAPVPAARPAAPAPTAPAAPEFIGIAAGAVLSDLFEQAGLDVGAVLSHFEVENLSDLTMDQGRQVRDRLDLRIEEKKALAEGSKVVDPIVAERLEALVKQTGTKLDAILQQAGVETFAELTEEQANRIITSLEALVEKAKAEAPPAAAPEAPVTQEPAAPAAGTAPSVQTVGKEGAGVIRAALRKIPNEVLSADVLKAKFGVAKLDDIPMAAYGATIKKLTRLATESEPAT